MMLLCKAAINASIIKVNDWTLIHFWRMDTTIIKPSIGRRLQHHIKSSSWASPKISHFDIFAGSIFLESQNFEVVDFGHTRYRDSSKVVANGRLVDDMIFELPMYLRLSLKTCWSLETLFWSFDGIWWGTLPRKTGRERQSAKWSQLLELHLSLVNIDTLVNKSRSDTKGSWFFRSASQFAVPRSTEYESGPRILDDFKFLYGSSYLVARSYDLLYAKYVC